MTLYTRDFETVKRSIHMGGVKSLDYVFVCKFPRMPKSWPKPSRDGMAIDGKYRFASKFLFGFYYKMAI
jgi:hypothetical protein